MNSVRIYLDNAATSWPKPEGVYQAVNRYLREVGAPAGRGGYREAAEAERLVAEARRRAAGLVGAPDARQIIFTANGTDSLNLALHGFLRSGDHVVTSVLEHNSVLRPLKFLETQRGIAVDRVGCDGQGIVDPEAIRAAIRPNTRLIALVHASNVTGAIQPIQEVSRIAKERGVYFLVDAAQSLGQLPFSLQDVPVDLLAAPGHKGLLGPLGTGLLYVASSVAEQLQPVRQGGTGTQSELETQPESLPAKFESGNHNVPGLAGLAAGLMELETRGVAALRQHHQQLVARLLAGLADCPHVRVVGPGDATRQVGVVSMQVKGYDPQEVAALLDATHGIQVRAGFHCAAQTHRALGTAAGGGTVRMSVGPFSTDDEIDTAIRAIAELAAD